MVGGLFALHRHAPRTRARIAKDRPVFCSGLPLVAIPEWRGSLVASKRKGYLVVCGAVCSATQTQNDQPWALGGAPFLEVRADAGCLLVGTCPGRSACRDLRAIRPAGGSNEPAATHAPRLVYAKVIQRDSAHQNQATCNHGNQATLSSRIFFPSRSGGRRGGGGEEKNPPPYRLDLRRLS